MMILKPITCSIDSLSDDDLRKPTYTFCPQSLKKNVDTFKANLPARLLYPIKANPQPFILKALNACGVYDFDVASIHEIELIHQYAQHKTLYFMHPVKPRHAISEAYFKFGVKHFAFDSAEEIEKIFFETERATDLCLHLRVQAHNTHSAINLSKKFGAPYELILSLLKKASGLSENLGLCFHVGSQCMEPSDYLKNINRIKSLLDNIPIPIKYFDIGGGLPTTYLNSQPPPLTEYFEKINLGLASLKDNYILLSEPGRALVADTMSLIARVDLRKKNILYINAGIYDGLLLASGSTGFTIPARKVKPYQTEDATLEKFTLYGPTCDSSDKINGDIYLPYDIQEGNYIELGRMGAYTDTASTNFHGFTHNSKVIIVKNQTEIPSTS